MNLAARDLRAFIALCDERNFTRAARKVHLSQSAFSSLVQGIEDGMGARLFDRTTRSVTLTPEGRLFEPSARRVLADLEGMVSDFRGYAERRTGRAAVAALPSVAAGWLPGVLADFRRSHPGIDLSLMDALAEQCKTLLRGRRVDFAIATVGDHDTDLDTQPLVSDAFYLVCTKRHPLARKRTIAPADLAPHAFVHLSRSSSVRQAIDAALGARPLQAVLEVEHLATVAALVEAGLGVTVVPELTLFHFRKPQLAVRRLHWEGLRRELVLMRRRNEALSVAAQGLWDLVAASKPRVRPTGKTASRAAGKSRSA
jgi:DNA-binding transcriptional LysR family regulator